MKNIYFLLIGLIWVSGSSAQELVNDTSYYYDGVNQNWNLDGRKTVIQRNINDLERFAFEQSYDDDTDIWSDRYRFTTGYHVDSLSLLYTEQEVWNPDEEQWKELKYKQYDSDGNLTDNKNRTWDFETNQYESGTRYTYSFVDGRLINKFYDELDVPNNSWVHVSFTEYTYNSDELVSEKHVQHFDGSTWSDYSLALLEYDMNGNLTEETGYSNQDSKGWEYSYQWNYDYNGDNQRTDFYYSSHDGSVWVPVLWFEYAYHSNGELEESIMNSWQDEEWVPDTRESRSFNDNDSYNYFLTESYSSGAWVNENIRDYVYDDQGHLVTVLKREWNGYFWEATDRYVYEYEGDFLVAEHGQYKAFDMWMNDRRTEYSWYEPVATSVSDYISETKLFPNPCNNYLHINAEGEHFLQVFSVSGKLITAEYISGNYMLDVSGYPSGVYFLQMDDARPTKFFKQ